MASDKAIGELPTVLLLEDTIAGQERFKGLTKHRLEVSSVQSRAEFERQYAKMIKLHKPPQAVVIDLVLSTEKRPEGLSQIFNLRSANKDLPIVVWTKHSDKYKDEALRLGADKVVTKFGEEVDLADLLEQLISHQHRE